MKLISTITLLAATLTLSPAFARGRIPLGAVPSHAHAKALARLGTHAVKPPAKVKITPLRRLTKEGGHVRIGFATRYGNVEVPGRPAGVYNVVSRVKRGSLADDAGIKPGDIYLGARSFGLAKGPATDPGKYWKFFVTPRSVLTVNVLRAGAGRISLDVMIPGTPSSR